MDFLLLNHEQSFIWGIKMFVGHVMTIAFWSKAFSRGEKIKGVVKKEKENWHIV